MKSTDQVVALPLDYAAELAMELHLMRGECCAAAKSLLEKTPADGIGLNECIVLEEALARSQAVLQHAVAKIRRYRGARM